MSGTAVVGSRRMAPSPPTSRRGFTIAVACLLAAASRLASLAAAQIGHDPARFVAVMGVEQDAIVDDAFRTEGGLDVAMHRRGNALHTIGGRGELDDRALLELAALVAAGTGLGAGIEGPVAEFLRSRLADLAGRGAVVIGVERHRLTLDVRGTGAPFDVVFSLALAEVDAAALPTSRHAVGPADARIVVREFSDFQCPFCRRFVTDVLPQLEETVLARGDVRFEYHHFPLRSIHPNADRAAEASECAADAHPDDPHAFWRYHDALFEHQAAWSGLTDPDAYFVDLAVEAGIDPASLAACLTRGDRRATVDAAYAAAVALGLRGTPTVFVNAFPLEDFTTVGAYLEAIGWIEAFAGDAD
jgi:protein-disulfide isomerase